MDNKKSNELNLYDLLSILKARWVMILIVAVITAAVAFGYSKFLVVPQYRATAQMIVDARNDENSVITNSQLNTAKQLVLTYAEIIETNSILNAVIEELDLEENYKQLQNKVTVHAVEDTQILQIHVTDADPEKALNIVRKIVEVTPVILDEKIASSKIASIDDPDVTSSPISPNVTRYALIGFVAGFILMYAYFLLRKLFDNKIRSAEDIQTILDLPVLGVIPALEHVTSK